MASGVTLTLWLVILYLSSTCYREAVYHDPLQAKHPPSYAPTSIDGQLGHWVLAQLVYNKPCTTLFDPRTSLPWDSDSVIQAKYDFVFLPATSELPLETIYDIAREHIQQRFTLRVDPEDLHMYLKIRMESHEMSPRVVIHEGNHAAVRHILLANPGARLQVWFGEVKSEEKQKQKEGREDGVFSKVLKKFI